MEHEFTVFGQLDICVAREPESWIDGVGEGECLGIGLTGPQWESIFYQVLNYTGAEPYKVGEDVDEYYKRVRSHFQSYLCRFPMLSRIWNIYEGVNYMPDEVEPLRDECYKVLSSTANPYAVEGLNNLIIGCNKALELGYGMVLESD